MTSIDKFEVNLTAPNKAGKGLGTATLAKPLELGGHIDLEFSIVGKRLRVLVDGKVALDMENDFIPGAGSWGLAAGNAWFSNIQIRQGGETPDDARLAQLEAAYAAACQREVFDVHLQAVKELDEKYAAALDRAMEASSKAGNLDDAVAYKEEKERVMASKPLPQGEKPVLQSLQQTYQSTLTQLTAQREQRLRDLRDKFVNALDLYQKELTQAGDLDGALNVRTRKERELEMNTSN